MIAINEWLVDSNTFRHIFKSEMSHGTSQDKHQENGHVFYINDNYRGGRTYVNRREVYEPERSSGLLFQGIYIPWCRKSQGHDT